MLYILNFFCDKHPSKFRKGCWCKEAERIRMVEENFHKINSWRVNSIKDWKLMFHAEKWFQLLVENWIILFSQLLRQIVSHEAFIYFLSFFLCMHWKIFRYQICFDLLWEQTVLVIKKNFWNFRLKVENFQDFWDHKKNLFKQRKFRTIYFQRQEIQTSK